MADPSATAERRADDLMCAGFELIKAALDGDINRVKGIAQSLSVGNGQQTMAIHYFGILHMAAGKGHLEICKYLVEELRAHVNMAAPDGGITPLMASAMHDHVPVVKYLLDHGGDPMKSDYKRCTVLHHAARTGSSKVTEFLLSKGIPVDIDLGHGTPLYSATNRGEYKTMKVLLDHHANPNIVFFEIATPLMIALLHGSLKCMELLIEAGADVNGKGAVTSPLIVATEHGGFINFIKLLLKAGADPNICDSLGRLPIELAALNNCREEVEMLFPLTLPIPNCWNGNSLYCHSNTNVPNWSVDGVISHAKLKDAKPMIEGKKAKLKSEADKALGKEDYDFASGLYSLALCYGQDAALYSGRSLCKVKMDDGAGALLDANRCRMMRPDWAEACNRQAAAHMLLKDYKQARDALLDAKKLDPENDEIERELRKAMELMETSGVEEAQQCKACPFF